MSQKLLKLAQLLGLSLAIAAIGLILRSIWTQRSIIIESISIAQALIITVGGMGIYIFGNLLLGLAWNTLLKWQGVVQVSMRTNVGIYGRTQLLKYIPGNLFSWPSRHLISRQHGMMHGPLVGAAVFEIAGLLAASSLVSIIGILFTANDNTLFILPVALSLFIITITSPLIVKGLYKHFSFFRRISAFQAVAQGNFQKLLAAWFLYVCFFILTGIILLWIIVSIDGTWQTIPITIIFSVYAISWFTGFITPGAPAGAGVREGVLVLLLSGYIGEPKSILASILLRFATMSGDIAFYGISLFLVREIWQRKTDDVVKGV